MLTINFHRIMATQVLLAALWANIACTAKEQNRTRMPSACSVENSWRFVMDNDGNEAKTMRVLTREEFLAQRMGALAETELDCIFYCTNSVFGLATRKSNVWQMRDYGYSGQAGWDVAKLAKAGIDPLQVTIDFGKSNDIEIFNSIRMNDIHDHNFRTVYARPLFLQNNWKQEHLDWLLSTQGNRSRTGAWSAVNYAEAGVRNKMLAFIKEAATEYDLDGISLDFFRHPVFFRATFDGKKCSDEDRKAMTSLIASVHKVMDDQSKRRGRKIKLAIRIPDSLDYCHDIGLDVESWLKHGWIDILVVSGYFRLNDWEYSAQLGRKYGVVTLASLDEPRIRDKEGMASRSTPKSYLGRAAAIRNAGLNGVVTFNLFNPESPVFQQLGSPERWPGIPKDFHASIRGITRANGGNLPYQSYQSSGALTPQSPISVSSGKTASATIPVSPADKMTRILWLRYDRPVKPEDIVIKINGRIVKMQKGGNNWLSSSDALDQEGSANIRVDIKSQTSVKWLDAIVRDSDKAN